MQTRSKRWLAFLLIGAAVSVAWLVWHVLHTIPTFDMRAEAARSDAVIYGVVGESPGHRQVVVEEIWKSSSTSAAELRIGSTVAVPPVDSSTAACSRDFFDGSDRHHFFPRVATMFATRASNQTMERTATRRAFTPSIATTHSLRSTLALGGRRSSFSR